MADPTSPEPNPKGPRPTSMRCDACQKSFPASYRFCPLCARTLRESDHSLEDHLGMGLPGRFDWRLLAAIALLLGGMTAFGIYRLSLIPATPPPEPSARPAGNLVEQRFASDLAKLGYDVQFKGAQRAIVLIEQERWDALGRRQRLAPHALVGDFRRALAAHQRDLNDPTEYRIEVRAKDTNVLLAEETDFNLKVYP